MGGSGRATIPDQHTAQQQTRPKLCRLQNAPVPERSSLKKKDAGSFSQPEWHEAGRVREVSYWRVEGSLFEISALRSVGFFNWHSQSFPGSLDSPRWAWRR